MERLVVLLTVSLIHVSKNQIIGPAPSQNVVVLIKDQERGILSKPSAYVIGPNSTTLVLCTAHRTGTPKILFRDPASTHALHIRCKGLRHKVRLKHFSTTNDDQSITTRLIVTPQAIKKRKQHLSCYCFDASNKGKSPRTEIPMKLSPENSTGSPFSHFKPNRDRIRTVTLHDSIKFSWRFPNASLVQCMRDGYPLAEDKVVYEDDKISVLIHEAFREDAGFYYCRSKSGVFSPWLKLQVKGGWSKWQPWLTCSAHCGPGKKIETRRCLETRRERCQGANVRTLPCVGQSCEGIASHFVDEPVDQVILNGSLANVTCAAKFDSSVFTLEMFCSSNGLKISYSMIQNETATGRNTTTTVVRLVYQVQLHGDRNNHALVSCHCYMSTNQSAKRSRTAKIIFSSEEAYTTSRLKPSFKPPILMGATNQAVTVKAYGEKSEVTTVWFVVAFTFVFFFFFVIAFYKRYTWIKNRSYKTITLNRSRNPPAILEHQGEPMCCVTERVLHVEPPETKRITLRFSTSSEEYDTFESRASNSPFLKKHVEDHYEPTVYTPHPSGVMTEETGCELDCGFRREESWKSNKSAYSSVSAGFCPKPKLPDTVHPDLCAWGEFTAKGGRLTIEGTGVNLYIPTNALPEQTAQVIYIGLMNSKGVYPNLKDQEALLSPVIVCGPDGLTFEKPVFLTVPHHAVLDENNCWHLKVQSSNTVDKEERGNNWKLLEQPGGDAPLSHVSDKYMQIMIDHFTNFAVVGEPNSTQEASAQLKAWITAYYTEPKIDEDCITRIYCIPATDAAYKVLEGIESKLNGKMSDSPKLLQICNNNQHLQITSKMTHVGWKTVTGELKSIPFAVIWECIKQSPNVSFIFERVDKDSFKFRSIFDTRQEESGTGVEVSVCFSIQGNRRNSSGYESQANGCQTDAKYKIPIEIRRELCHLLDPEKPMFNDWRCLAEKLELSKVYINSLKGNNKIKSPTDEVIELWEMTLSESKPLSVVENILRDMNRDDAVKVLQKIPGLESTS